MSEKTIYDLKLHEVMLLHKNDRASIVVIRVPGGFLYQCGMNGTNGMFDTCFVPYEGQQIASTMAALNDAFIELKALKYQLEGDNVVDHTAYLSKLISITSKVVTALRPVQK